MRVVRGGSKLRRPFLDISARIGAGGERGLLSIAFAPDYAAQRALLRLLHGPDGDIRIVEYRRASADARRPRLGARRALGQPHPASNHNGGLVLFGPDGLLYVGLGDGGGGGDQHGARGNGQNLGTLLGKILRIDPRRAAAAPTACRRRNPFVGRGGARPEIYAYGLRNPWRFSFTPQRATSCRRRRPGRGRGGRPSCAASGRRTSAGACSRAAAATRRARRRPGHVPPVIQRFHSDGNCSITGGVVVRDPVLSALRGRYVFGDFCRGRIESARLRGTRRAAVRATRLQVDAAVVVRRGRPPARLRRPRSSGPVYRLVPR